jgi:hypothetical protein
LQDGRLRINDQLVEVNGVSLLGLDNAHALNILREAMQKDGRVRGFIGITIARPRNSQVVPQPVVVSPQEVRVSQTERDETDATDCAVDQSIGKFSDDRAPKPCKKVSVNENLSVSSSDSSYQELFQNIQRASGDCLPLTEDTATPSSLQSPEVYTCSEVNIISL